MYSLLKLKTKTYFKNVKYTSILFFFYIQIAIDKLLIKLFITEIFFLHLSTIYIIMSIYIIIL